ncbi:MAG TPA: DUF4256 domain-containing protein [Candidatus Pseudogracilibacillus intestinigallinarum]|uniref:DUF4256 domain-containing protein n=1 Tax=Candidatus Pseudogracilibacillus intestinigallinarum TaxID=2838742 RepID=A0A9D1PN07_9BACI|nr:DUF4256 domain-containing protein [Candidatus Pseudogracilibacillus intestinigallinarum]
MIDETKQSLTIEERTNLVQVLEERFENHSYRHETVTWEDVEQKLTDDILLSLYWMEETGGEPDVILFEEGLGYVDCVKETPEGRRSVCYDDEALQKRKKYKPDNSAQNMASQMGIGLVTETEYEQLQRVEKVDLKTSSWIQTDEKTRSLGGAIFGDRRYDRVFIYHNGADSYYKVRGFRGVIYL